MKGEVKSIVQDEWCEVAADAENMEMLNKVKSTTARENSSLKRRGRRKMARFYIQIESSVTYNLTCFYIQPA